MAYGRLDFRSDTRYSTSRLILERHTLLQVAAGTANGVVCVWLALMFAA